MLSKPPILYPKAVPFGLSLALLMTGCMAAPTGSPQPSMVGTMAFVVEATIPDLQDAMAKGELTSVQLVDLYLARIDAYDESGPALNALIAVNPAARQIAAALDAERAESGPRGMLHGIPVVLKDNIDVADVPTTAGSFALEGSTPADDADVTRRLREAGAIILAKTNLPDFAFSWSTISSAGGQTLSPYDVTREPGGSSGGTAVAVTANLAAAGLGSDTCGSIRLPSGLNGLVGLRPTAGLVSGEGVVPLAPTLDAVGPMARSVVDVAILLDVIARGAAEQTSDTSFFAAVGDASLAGRRIGTISAAALSGAALDVREIYRSAREELTAAGSELIEVPLPTPTVNIFALFDEFGSAFEDYLETLPNPPVSSADELRDRYGDESVHPDRWPPQPAPSLDSPEYQAALAGRDAFREAVIELMDEHDLDAIAYPASNGSAAPTGVGVDPFNCETAAYSGLPAIVVPAGVSSKGLPLGMELLGRPMSERTLLNLAAGYEELATHRFPPTATPALP